jgi:hypothetical protein
MKIWLKDKQYEALDGIGWTDWHREYGKPFNEHELEVFYYWFEFLKRSRRATWSRRVKADFEDISMDADGTLSDIPFEEWWRHHNRLFWKPRLLSVEVLSNDMLDHFNDQVMEEGSRIRLLALFLDQPRERLRAKFEQILQEYEAGKEAKGRYIYEENYQHPPDEEEDRYIIHVKKNARYRPNTGLLRNALEVYDVYMQIENGTLQLENWKIEELISNKRGPDEKKLISRKPRFEKPINKLKSGESPITYKFEDLPNKNQIQASTVSRYKRYADRLIANVAKGIFPKTYG